MHPDIAAKVISWISNFFSEEISDVSASLRQGLAIQEYQVKDATRQALMIGRDILEAFNRERDRYCADDAVKHCLELAQDGYENKWKDFSKTEFLERLLASTGILAVDIGLPEKAIALFNIQIQLAPDSLHPLMGLAYANLYIGSPHEAMQVIREKILTIEPGNDLGLAFLALAYQELRQPEEALAAASAVIVANRDDSAVSLAREVQRSLGRPAG